MQCSHRGTIVDGRDIHRPPVSSAFGYILVETFWNQALSDATPQTLVYLLVWFAPRRVACGKR